MTHADLTPGPETSGPGPGGRVMLGPGSLALAVYGAIAAGLAVAIGADAALSILALAVAVLVELGVFFVAHAYVDAVGERYDHPDYTLPQRLGHGLQHSAMVLLGGVPVLLVVVVEGIVGVDTDTGATVALVGLVPVLWVFGYLAARRGGSRAAAAVGEGSIVALIGVAILGLKLLLK